MGFGSGITGAPRPRRRRRRAGRTPRVLLSAR
uniref:Uncharacterized protein n=1 Tax=Leersia perrieri TaxID=77586 RepID=A0A0D9WDB3_9ORYZ